MLNKEVQNEEDAGMVNPFAPFCGLSTAGNL
jgi:hypothetical protein